MGLLALLASFALLATAVYADAHDKHNLTMVIGKLSYKKCSGRKCDYDATDITNQYPGAFNI